MADQEPLVHQACRHHGEERKSHPVVHTVLNVMMASTQNPRAAVQEHIDLVDEVVNRLKRKGDFCYILTNRHYQQREHQGEIDVLGVHLLPDHAFYTYFEIKSSETKNSMRTGKEQISAWKKYMRQCHSIDDSYLDGKIITPKNIDGIIPCTVDDVLISSFH